MGGITRRRQVEKVAGRLARVCIAMGTRLDKLVNRDMTSEGPLAEWYLHLELPLEYLQSLGTRR